MPDLTKTRDQLVTRALVKLSADGGAGQTPDAEDSAVVDDAVDGVLADLRERGVCDVVNDAEIPTAWFEDLADILAQTMASDFGQQRDNNVIARAEVMLRKKNAGRATGETQRAEYF